MDATGSNHLRYDRLTAAVLTIVAAAVLGVACWLTPASGGVGTHTQLGMAPCGMLRLTGVPCATCGMTTSFTYAAHGQLWKAFVTQPAGALLALMTAMMLLVSGYAVVTGMPIFPLVRRLVEPRGFVILGIAIAIAWVYKVAAIMAA